MVFFSENPRISFPVNMSPKVAKKGYVLGVFLDIEAALDNVSFKAIAAAIRKTYIPIDH